LAFGTVFGRRKVPELANYKHMRRLIEAWVGLAMRLAKEKRQSAA
jgi:hypothetical protein